MTHRQILKVVKAPAFPGESKGRQKGSVERGVVWWVLETRDTSVAATSSLRERVVENEFKERAEMPIRKAFAGQYIDLAFILEALSRGETKLDNFKGSL